MTFRLSKVQVGKSQEGKQLKFAPQLDKYALWKLALRNLMFWKRNQLHF